VIANLSVHLAISRLSSSAMTALGDYISLPGTHSRSSHG
jgi:hypothetical protein